MVGYALARFPDEIRAELELGAGEPDTPVVELVIILSNGADYHYVGTAFAEDYSDAFPRTYHYAQKAQAVIISFPPTQPVAVFSQSAFLSHDEQLSILKALFPTMIW